MINTRDVSRELVPFAKSFNSFCRDGYRFDGGDVYADLLDYGLEGFKVKTNPEICFRLKDKYKEDEAGLHALFVELAKLYGDNVGEGWQWFDALGNIYEAIASGYKKSSSGIPKKNFLAIEKAFL